MDSLPDSIFLVVDRLTVDQMKKLVSYLKDRINKCESKVHESHTEADNVELDLDLLKYKFEDPRLKKSRYFTNFLSDIEWLVDFIFDAFEDEEITKAQARETVSIIFDKQENLFLIEPIITVLRTHMKESAIFKLKKLFIEKSFKILEDPHMYYYKPQGRLHNCP